MWIDFQAKASEMGPYFGAMEDLLSPIGYRKHWAKGMDHTNPDAIMQQFPKLPEFLALMEKFDPDGKFRNEHTDMWFKKTKESIRAQGKQQARSGLLSASFGRSKEVTTSLGAPLEEVAELRTKLAKAEAEIEMLKAENGKQREAPGQGQIQYNMSNSGPASAQLGMMNGMYWGQSPFIIAAPGPATVNFDRMHGMC
jgi:hypothetical protein